MEVRSVSLTRPSHHWAALPRLLSVRICGAAPFRAVPPWACSQRRSARRTGGAAPRRLPVTTVPLGRGISEQGIVENCLVVPGSCLPLRCRGERLAPGVATDHPSLTRGYQAVTQHAPGNPGAEQCRASNAHPGLNRRQVGHADADDRLGPHGPGSGRDGSPSAPETPPGHPATRGVLHVMLTASLLAAPLAAKVPSRRGRFAAPRRRSCLAPAHSASTQSLGNVTNP